MGNSGVKGRGVQGDIIEGNRGGGVMDKVTDHLKTGYVVYNLDGVPQAIFLDGGVE